ncbi:MAG: hypothetical protein KKH67_12035 [candidate division Zixibacteria bacterium]|nr:hypothetical protein [candidate division Zixibacteria bacterium]MBU1471066.1 hypothetical protein [candidate division Zixibacteria bacterium]
MTIDRPSITIIYTDIGRGHPNYLDSVLRYMRVHHPQECEKLRITSIFEVSRGTALTAWKAIKWLYRTGSRGGLISDIYGSLRSGKSEFDPDSHLIKILQRDLLKYVDNYDGICLVAHPLLANMLKSDHRVFYLHGEIAAPRESVTSGVERIYVPLPETAEKMRSQGVDADSLFETGLVLEPELLADVDEVVNARLARIERHYTPLTIGFFISGAYPKRHIDLMLAAAESCRRAGHRVQFFWGSDKRQIDRLVQKVRRFDENAALDFGNEVALACRTTVVVSAESREEETTRSMSYLPQLDLFCAAPHERVNWAVGAGLPMLMIAPPIGTFAPQNLDFVLQSKCGLELTNRHQFETLGEMITRLRTSGDLTSMVTSGRNIKSIHGAKVITESLLAAL